MKKKAIFLLSILLSLTSCNSSIVTSSFSSTSYNSSSSISNTTSIDSPIKEVATKRFDKVHEINKLTSYRFNIFQEEKEVRVKQNENGHVEVTNPTYYYGNVNSLNITPKNGYRTSIILRNNLYYSDGYKYFYTNTSDIYEVKFVKEDKIAVTFLDEGYRFLTQYELDKNQEIPRYEYEEKEGYKLTLNQEYDVATKDLVIYPIYIKEGTPNIELKDIAINEESYSYNSLISFTPSSSNMFFDSYYKDGEIVSTSKNYKTKIRDDFSLEAKFTTSPTTNIPLITLDKTYKVDGDKLYISGEYNNLENLTLVEIGVAYKKDKDDLLDEATLTNFVNTSEEDNSFTVPLDNKKGYYQGYLTYRRVTSDSIDYITYLSYILEIE